MTQIDIPTSNNKIWNKENIIIDIMYAMSKNDEILLDLLFEGPDLSVVGLYDIIEKCANKFSYNLSNITIDTCNMNETHPYININYSAPLHLVYNGNKNLVAEDKILHNIKIFGVFIARSNSPRLTLVSYLDKKYSHKTIYTYRYNIKDDFIRDNIGLEDLIRDYNIKDVSNESKFLSKCPILLQNSSEIMYKKDSCAGRGPLQQLLETDANKIDKYYKNFFIELVCETYFSGNTFFPTEKIWRPILLKTPFIVQGPQFYLKNLKKLGFKTFDTWWDEGYDIDPDNARLESIKQNIDWIASQTNNTINDWHYEMQGVLNHNYNTLKNISITDFRKV